ncbi:phosphoadenosine phosphosulfate reductase [Streptomyces sp. ASQP_92]|uniref:phosphoadenosine phosphosulfate reductase n=1 Tax=Streptomyces sp. ASQP_92 TaxID=2979116 RepID=UPI0021BDF53A|nr:phosphoadenosine phosphosulfate reductase [Streptomyces sp. ASQP_92]MCT9093463.1 phosphoadenosine phosphosulfate reductase [Streptomyces sp. ASQP_92]
MSACLAAGPARGPDLASYDLIAPQLSGGNDSALTMWLLMNAARAAGVTERVRSFHACLGPLDWPSVTYQGTVWPGVAELAALQSTAFGLPAGQHTQVTRTLPGPGGSRMPHSLLTEIAAYGRFPRMGSKFCTKAAKESVVSMAWTPYVTEMSRELGRPVRILKVQGHRRDESRLRSTMAAFRTVQVNSARIVDEWLPALEWPRPAVREWSQDHPRLRHWTYDSVPGAGDFQGTSRCSCSLCGFAGLRDLLLAVARRPRLAALYAEVETARGDRLRPDWSITDLIRHASTCGIPDPGVICPDNGPDFTALERQVRTQLTQPPRKPVGLAAHHTGRTLCEGCQATT